MDPFRLEHEHAGDQPGVVTLWLEQGDRPVVVLDQDLIQRLELTLKNLPENTAGLVLASAAPRAFVAGADLRAIVELDDARLHTYLENASRVFSMLTALPYFTVAAIHAAALGGGLELAMHCDGLIGCPPAERDGKPGRPYPVGLPEAGLSICPGWGGTNLLLARMDPADAIRRTATGEVMNSDEAIRAGLFDAVAGSYDDLIETARQWIRGQAGPVRRTGAPSRWIGCPDVSASVLEALDAVRGDLMTPSGMAVCEAVDTGLAKGWRAALAVEQDHLVRLRSSAAGKAAIEAFFAKSAKKA
ncbi:MAG TPA: enoyl-CoA hydratase/isomerase family protein [Phycisphaerales bacterium]|nr:enoyl-CoA hydratase/isomerase family protein [Phycisphaerales bacterium]